MGQAVVFATIHLPPPNVAYPVGGEVGPPLAPVTIWYESLAHGEGTISLMHDEVGNCLTSLTTAPTADNANGVCTAVDTAVASAGPSCTTATLASTFPLAMLKNVLYDLLIKPGAVAVSMGVLEPHAEATRMRRIRASAVLPKVIICTSPLRALGTVSL